MLRGINKQDIFEDEEKLRISDSKVKEYLKEAGIIDPRELRQLEKSQRV